MTKITCTLAGLAMLAGCQPQAETAAADAAAPQSDPLNSGIDFAGMDTSVRPQDDFFSYANGRWVAETEIPGDQSGWGSFNILRDTSLAQLQTIIEESAADASETDTAAKIGNYYNAYMNAERADALGIAPLEGLFAQIDALQDHDAVAAFSVAATNWGSMVRSSFSSARM